MSKQALRQYMALTSLDKNAATVERTFLVFNEQKHSVKNAPPKVFDSWVSQFVKKISDVDRDEWEPFQRWQIINELLAGKFLVLRLESGTFFLRSKAEEKSSEPTSENVDKPASQAG